jgi:hypothetical protein
LFVADLGVSFPSPLPSIFLLFFLPPPFPVSVASRYPGHATPVLRALLHKTKKQGKHATAAALHVSRITSQLRPCLVPARGFAPVCAPCILKKQRQFVQKKQNKKKRTKKNRARGTIGSATPVGTRFGLAACLPSFVLSLVFFLCLFSFAPLISSVCDGLSTLI